MMVLTPELEKAIENVVFDGLVNDIVSYNANERAERITDEIVALIMDQPGTRFGV